MPSLFISIGVILTRTVDPGDCWLEHCCHVFQHTGFGTSPVQQLHNQYVPLIMTVTSNLIEQYSDDNQRSGI